MAKKSSNIKATNIQVLEKKKVDQSELKSNGKTLFYAMNMSSKKMQLDVYEKDTLKYVLWGENHFVPQKLIYLKDNSPVHGSIIESKAADIAGDKIVMVNPEDVNLKIYLDKVNRYNESAFDVIKKICQDFATFGAFAYQIIYNKFGTSAEIFHLPFETVVPAKKDEFGKICSYYISEDWTKSKPNTKMLPAFDPQQRGGSQVYFYVPYSVGGNYFPKPDYAKGLVAIQTEIRLNNLYESFVKNGFFSSVMLNFNNGVPTEEEADEIYKRVVKEFGGEENAGKILINFSNGKEFACEVEVLPITDADKLFNAITDINESKIHKAHRIVSPMLVGSKTEGQLGGNNELLNASELYFNTVIKPKQRIVQGEFNYILKSLGFVDGINIIPNQPVSFTFSENILTQILTKDELRAKIGYKPLSEINSAGTNAIE